jgi:hypothetical protein
MINLPSNLKLSKLPVILYRYNPAGKPFLVNLKLPPELEYWDTISPRKL